MLRTALTFVQVYVLLGLAIFEPIPARQLVFLGLAGVLVGLDWVVRTYGRQA